MDSEDLFGGVEVSHGNGAGFFEKKYECRVASRKQEVVRLNERTARRALVQGPKFRPSAPTMLSLCAPQLRVLQQQ